MPCKTPEECSPKESKVSRMSHGRDLYTPKKRERKAQEELLTVDQYLRKSEYDKGLSGLIRSLYKTKVITLGEWDREAAALLKKRIC
jgi:hypothetical protein